MATDYRKTKLRRVLVDSGEMEFDAAVGAPLSKVVEQGGRWLDGLCLNNLLLVEGSDGQFYLGEFAFELRRVSRRQAERMAKEHGNW
jgi:hypothetical protein